MSRNIKLVLYVVLTIAVVWTGINFFSRLKDTSAKVDSAVLAETNEAALPVTNTPPAEPDTNAVTDTNVVATNVVADATNAPSSDTNIAASVTNEVTAAAPPPAAPPADDGSSRRGMTGAASMIGALVKFAAALICLGGLIAYDVSQYFSNKAIDFMFNDDLKGVRNEEYEAAEQMHANGRPLEAIQMMREYLRKNPREQYVALRIAEIYEKDLNNDLAAALEYEQVLEKKLPRERWGWAAIHLCNLYSRLGKTDQTVQLLRRIAEEYGDTAAAKKARKRLAMFESVGDETSLGTDMPEDPNMPDIPPAPKPKPEVRKVEKAEPPSNLPPGFRPKK